MFRTVVVSMASIVLCFVVGICAAAEPDAVDKGLLGIWAIESLKLDGKEIQRDQVPDKDRRRFYPISFYRTNGYARYHANGFKFTVDISKQPKQVTLNRLGDVYKGIYRIEEGRLWTCFSRELGGARPQEFSGNPEIPNELTVYHAYKDVARDSAEALAQVMEFGIGSEITRATYVQLRTPFLTDKGAIDPEIYKTLGKLKWIYSFSAGPFQSNSSARSHFSGEGLKQLSGFKDLYLVHLMDCPHIKGTDLQHLIGMPKLSELSMHNCEGFDGKGLRHLAQIPTLRTLVLFDSPITDESLVELHDTNLVMLGLSRTLVSDAGLAKLVLPKLKRLSLSETKVSSAGLAHLKNLPALEVLVINDTKVSDDGLPHLQQLPNLQKLHLDFSDVSSAGLQHLTKCVRLTELNLGGDNITDSGLKHLAEIPKLNYVSLRDTKVTPDGVKELKTLRPKLLVTGVR